MTLTKREIVANLLQAKVPGLPEFWFSGAAPESSPTAIPELDRCCETDSRQSEDVGAPAAERIMNNDKLESDVSASYSSWSWSELEAAASGCRKCRLCEGRTKVVFGDGKRERPLIAFVGEGPGAEEDKRGVPFVGRAGELLTAAISKGMGLTRDDVYIANVVKCRPPENRAPLPDETEACTPYLYRQLELLQPRVIVTLGQPAQLALSGVQLGITKLRGQWQEWRGMKLMPTFHPAYLLRNPPMKKPFWEDLQAVMQELGLPLNSENPGVKQ